MRTTPWIPLAFLTALALCAPPVVAPAVAEDAPKPKPWQFPRELTVAGRKTSMWEPTVLSRDAATGDVKLRFPLQIQDGAGRISWGAVDAAGRTHLDLSSRLFLVDGIAAGASSLPQLDDKSRDDVSKALPDALPKELTLRLELLTTGPGAAPPEPATPPKYSMTAPEILVRRTPAVLVQTDGEIVKDVVGDTWFEYAVNTASDLFHDPKTDVWYLLVDGFWMEAKSVQGPWKPAVQPPSVLSQVSIQHPRGHVRLFVPGTPEYAKRTAGKKPTPPATWPEVIVRDKPAELVLLAGDPLFLMVPGVKLMVVANTESDVLYHPRTARFFLLVSGRWYQAEEIDGPWTSVAGALPEEFAKIPRDHVRAHVLSCVPGTPEAAEAAALATLEERVTLTRATSIQVRYDGKDVRTLPIEGAPIKVAVNTDDDVVSAEGAWWCCARGMWFRSDDGHSAWSPAAKVPDAVAQLPETCGSYQVRFCRPLGAAEGGVVTGVTGGYSGVFLWKGAPVYGTGYSRRGLLRDANWYPYPRTFGDNRWYDPVAGVFQTRDARYDAEMNAVVPEWSPYTASYGRVKWYGSRYDQGGRRMFQFSESAETFDLSAARPDPFATWGTYVKERDGLKADRFPLGDRTGEAAPKDPPVVADAQGGVWRLDAKGVPETYKDDRWQAAVGCGDAEKAWLEALARANARPAQLRAWAEKRRAPIPVNPTVEKVAK